MAERMLQELIESEAAARIGAEWTEHTEARTAYRNGLLRLVTAVLLEMHDQCIAFPRRYLKAASTKSTPASALTNTEFSGDLHAGDASVREAQDSVLHRVPPLANIVITYPPRPVDIGGFLLPADRRWSSVTPPATTTPRWDPTGRWAIGPTSPGEPARTAARPDRMRTSSPKRPSSTSSTLCP
ncbi:hypothetical protein AB0O61_37890 [Streptomyces bungoensis]